MTSYHRVSYHKSTPNLKINAWSNERPFISRKPIRLGRTIYNLHETHVHPAISSACLPLDGILTDRSPNSSLGSCRFFTVSSALYDTPSSKVETAVQKLKDKEKSEKEEAEKKADVAAKTNVPETPKPVVVKKSLGQRIWAEILHYYHGFRLLFIDIKISGKLLYRVLRGKQLNRRERRLLVRTTSDLFRLVPFSIFIIVPFMELLLPVFIKFFPGMLPSTFQTAKEREDKLKQSLKVKVEVAKFLQHTLDEMAVHNKEHESEEAKEFVKFFKKVKNPNELVSNEEIIKFSKQFEDEITLDSLSREQLTALCRILELNTIGTTTFLRFQLRMKLRQLAADDRLIQRDGIDSLTLYELQSACRTRGMRAYGLSEAKLRSQLQEWIDLSLDEKVPPTLLLLSRALMVPEETSASDKLKATLKALPDTVATQTKAAIGEREGKIDNKTRIEIIREEERKIKEEREELAEIEKEKKREKKELLVDKAKVIEEIPAAQEEKAEEGITSKDAHIIHEALESISKEKKLIVQKEVIKELKEEIEDYKEDVEELKEVTTSTDKAEVKVIKEARGAKILFQKVNKMVTQLDDELARLEEAEKKRKAEAMEAGTDDSISYKGRKHVNVRELSQALRGLLKSGDDTRISNIEKFLEKMDLDNDGNIKVDDVIKVIETIRDDNVKLDGKQISELIELLSKEQFLEAEEKIEKALAKSLKESKQQGSERILDVAPVIEDKAEDLSKMDEKHILTKNEPVKVTSGIDNLRVEDAKAAAEQNKEKIIPSKPPADIPSIPPPTISSTTAKVNQKDKQI